MMFKPLSPKTHYESILGKYSKTFETTKQPSLAALQRFNK